jgi:hypothetical protein
MKTSSIWRRGRSAILFIGLSLIAVLCDEQVQASFCRASKPRQLTLYNVVTKPFNDARLANVHESLNAYLEHHRQRQKGVYQVMRQPKRSVMNVNGLDEGLLANRMADVRVATNVKEDDDLSALVHVRPHHLSPTLLTISGPVDNSMQDNEFLVRLAIGTPMQLFWALPDTGSPLTWVFGPQCCFAQNHSYFDYRKSSTFSYFYSNGTQALSNVTGFLANDGLSLTSFTYGKSNATTTTFAALDFVNLPLFSIFEQGEEREEAVKLIAKTGETLLRHDSNATVNGRPRHRFGIVTSSGDGSHITRKMEALLGLAPGLASWTQDGQPGLEAPIQTFFDEQLSWANNFVTFTLVKTSMQPAIAFDGSMSSPLNSTYGGRITLGDVDDEAIRGEVSWIENQSHNFWGTYLESNAMQIDSVDVLANVSSDSYENRVIFDTGSALIFMPSSVARRANSLLHGALYIAHHQRWVISCSYGTRTNSTGLNVSRFTVKLGTQTFGIPAEDLVLFPNQPVAYDNVTNERYCLTAFQEGADAFIVLGQTFIKNHVVIFDYGKRSDNFTRQRIGIANRKDIQSALR